MPPKNEKTQIRTLPQKPSGELQSPRDGHSERSEESPCRDASLGPPTRFFAALRMTVPTMWSKIATLQFSCENPRNEGNVCRR